MKLKDYQNKAVKELLIKSNDLISKDVENTSYSIVFKAPTGSGKTIMMAEFLKRFVKDRTVNYPVSFIWMAPRKLHNQSKEKLERYYSDFNTLFCLDFKDVSGNALDENEILFLNWESINKKDKNVITRENERDFYLSKVVENTKESGKKIILIIDESHHTAKSEASKNIIDDINPDLTIDVSATPSIAKPDEMVAVHIEDVKLEGMIKKEVILNDNFKNKFEGKNIESELAEGTDAMVLKEALKKREELEQAYKQENVDINPLLLVQLPDRTTLQKDMRQESIEKMLSNQGISRENRKLAVHLSGDKENIEYIAENNDTTEVLIMKHAVSLGWDCPRAAILVLFRDWKSIVFSIQTIGRIMRMPEQKHYRNEILNNGYVFTNISNVKIDKDIVGDYIRINTSHRIPEYQDIKLKSVSGVRHRERTRFSPLFSTLFTEEARNYELKDKIDTSNKEVFKDIPTDFRSSNVDIFGDDASKIKEQKVSVTNSEEIQVLYDEFIFDSIVPFYPEERSVNRVKSAIYSFFKIEMGIEYTGPDIRRIALGEKNQKHFKKVIEKTIELYINKTERRSKEVKELPEWEVPEILTFNDRYKEKEDAGKSVMQPFFSTEQWETEKAFVKYLDQENNSVEWWYKNGERDPKYFAVEYKDKEGKHPFYVDFIVKLKNGKIGLLDTKAGFTIEEAKTTGKSDGLQKYIKEQNKKGKKLFGGIVTNTDQKGMAGLWVIYQKEDSKDLSSKNFNKWDDLVL